MYDIRPNDFSSREEELKRGMMSVVVVALLLSSLSRIIFLAEAIFLVNVGLA